jgi:hypothetical protein
MEIALDYHGVLMFSKSVLDLLRLVEEALGVAADRRAVGGEPAQEPGGLPGASGWHTWSAPSGPKNWADRRMGVCS